MFLGEELTEILESIERGEDYDNKEKEMLKVGVHVLPRFPKTLPTETEHHPLHLQVINLSSDLLVLRFQLQVQT